MPSDLYPRLAETKPQKTILDNSVEVGIGGTNIGYYRSLGYRNIQIGDRIRVDPRKINLKTQIKVNAECPNPICGKVFQKSISRIVDSGHTYCRSCIF